MGRTKVEENELTRDKLEGFLWAATGWRGDPAVIDGILAKVDVYAENRIRVAGLEKSAMVKAAERAATRAAVAAIPEPHYDALSQEVLTALVDASTATGDAMGRVSAAVSAIERAAQAIRDSSPVEVSVEPVWSTLPGLEEVRIHPEDVNRLTQWYETLILRQAGRVHGPAEEELQQYAAESEAEHGPISPEEHGEAECVVDVTVGEPEPEHVPEVAAEDADIDAEADAIVDAVLNGAEQEQEQPERKRCSRCDLIKRMEEFHRDKASPDGYKYTCKKCDTKRAAARAERDKIMAASAAADKAIGAGAP